MTHAMFLKAGLGAGGLWSMSRGMARGLKHRDEYKQMLAMADAAQRGDRDGRGNLSLSAPQDLTLWFLRAALDQIEFMTSLFDADIFSTRLRRVVETNPDFDPRGQAILEAVFARGELPRGVAAAVSGLGDRMGRNILAQLTGAGLLTSDSPKGPVRIGLPPNYVDQQFPRLFYETPSEMCGAGRLPPLISSRCSDPAGLIVLITIFGPISGAHFNPAVTLAFVLRREIRWLLALG